MLNYTGRLLPYRPVIAAMLLAGQSCRQVADLLWEMGARSEFTDKYGPDDHGRRSTQGLIRVMDRKWSEKKRKSELPQVRGDFLDDSFAIDDVPLSTRARNALKNEGILTIGDVRAATDERLRRRIPNFGRQGLEELRSFLVSVDFAETVAADG